MELLNPEEYAFRMIELLCEYAGDSIVFEAFIQRWGIEDLYRIIQEILGEVEVDADEELEENEEIMKKDKEEGAEDKDVSSES